MIFSQKKKVTKEKIRMKLKFANFITNLKFYSNLKFYLKSTLIEVVMEIY